MFSRRKNSSDLVLPGEKGEKERVVLLEQQVKSLSETAAQAVDRSALLEKEVAHLREALYQQGRYQVHLQDRLNQAHFYHKHNQSLHSRSSSSSHNQARLPNSESMNSFVSSTSDKSSDSFASLFSDSSAISHTTIPEDGSLFFDDDSFPLFTTPELDLTFQFQQKVDESEHERQKLEDALIQERSLRESYEKQLSDLRSQIESLKISKRKTSSMAVSKSAQSQQSCNHDIRLRKLEVSVNAIQKAREVLNSTRLHQYV